MCCQLCTLLLCTYNTLQVLQHVSGYNANLRNIPGHSRSNDSTSVHMVQCTYQSNCNFCPIEMSCSKAIFCSTAQLHYMCYIRILMWILKYIYMHSSLCRFNSNICTLHNCIECLCKVSIQTSLMTTTHEFHETCHSVSFYMGGGRLQTML